MSDQAGMPDPNSAESPRSDADFTPTGNRPAANARQATPGSVLSQAAFNGDGEADDFLGLDAEMSGVPAAAPVPTDQVAPAPAPAVPAAPQPVHEASPLMKPEPVGDGFQVLSDEEADEAAEAVAREAEDPEHDHEDEFDSDDRNASWVEQPTSSGAAKRYGPRIAAAVVVGMLGMTGYYALQSAGQGETFEATPLAPELNTTPGYEENLLNNHGVNQSLGREPVGRNARPLQGAAAVATTETPAPATETSADTEAAEVLEPVASVEQPVASAESPALNIEESVAQVEDPPADAADSVTQVEPPVLAASLIPIWERLGESTSPGYDPDARAPGALSLPVLGGPDPDESSLEVAELDPEPVATEDDPLVVVAAALGDSVALEPAHETSIDPIADPVASEVAAVAPPAVAAGPLASGGYGPVLPAGTAPLETAPMTVTSSRVSRTAVAQGDSHEKSHAGPRKATAQEMKGVWMETSVPLDAVSGPDKLLTPRVGRVRVVLAQNEIFEGRLYAVGRGQVWMDTKFGRMGIDGSRVLQVLHIDASEGSPELGGPGAVALAGLERVRVRTPGGVFYGKVIARDEKHTTLVTNDGARVTLDSTMVEFLSDVPTIALKYASGADEEEEAQGADAEGDESTEKGEQEAPDVDGPKAQKPDAKPASDAQKP